MTFTIEKAQIGYSISSFSIEDIKKLRAAIWIAEMSVPTETMQNLMRVIDSFLNAIENEEPDAHNCRENANSYGYCQICGAIIHGSAADYDVHGYDPPESVRW